nr:phosphoribosylamine--glycine ligase [Acidobacteriota bacterium]
AMQFGKPITGLTDAAAVDGVVVFHAGTKRQGDHIVTSGGRVLAIVGSGSTYEDAMARAYAGARSVSYDGMEFRTDIGRKALTT